MMLMSVKNVQKVQQTKNHGNNKSECPCCCHGNIFVSCKNKVARRTIKHREKQLVQQDINNYLADRELS